MYSVLIADKEYIIRKYIRAGIDGERSAFRTAWETDNGTAALDIIRREIPDLVITDTGLPGRNGLEIAQTVYEEGIPSKMIFVSSYPDFEYARKAMEYGVLSYIMKPIHMEELETALKRVVRILEQSGKTEYETKLEYLKQRMDAIQRTKKYILSNHTDKKLSLNGIAAEIGMNPAYLSTKFKQETGMNLTDYVLDCRMQHAVDILRIRPDATLEELSDRIGFHDPYYFSRCFKKYYGISPNHFRDGIHA